MNTIFNFNNTTNNNTNNNNNNNNNNNSNAPCFLHADNKPYEFPLRSIKYFESKYDPKTGVSFNRTDDVRVLEKEYLNMQLTESVKLKNSTKISYKCAIDSPDESQYNSLLDDYIGLLKGSSYYADGYACDGKSSVVEWIIRSLTHKDPQGNAKTEHIYYICFGERPDEFVDVYNTLKCGDYGYGFHAEYANLNFCDDNPGEPLEQFSQIMYNAMQDVLDGMDVILIVDSASRVATEANQFPRPGEATTPGGLYYSALKWVGKMFQIAVKRRPHPVQKGSLTTIGTILKKEEDRQSIILTDTAQSYSNGHIAIGLTGNKGGKYIDEVIENRASKRNINLATSYSRAMRRFGIPNNLSEVEYLAQIFS